ncbi:MAG: hypothetical protein IKV24_04510 [Bacteroidaceae bacterium]|nr:hypothetical protein [Bacteroidaceae bacterium]
MNLRQLTCALLLALGLAANAANKVTKVAQVSTEVTLADEVDYIITDAVPFAAEGRVNITNTEHAALIIQSIRPSYVLKDKVLIDRVFINGEQAVDGVNCQVRMYAHGSIVLPYAKGFKPLTVYSEKNFEGTAVDDFGLEHASGFMNSLTDAKLNNQIRSFKLKRGYMVTFATGKSGWGYSRCFIADTEDLEFAELPAHLDGRISSYRVFQWHDAEKKGLASDTRKGANELLASSWCYTWGVGENMLPDHECIPHRIHEGWPAPADCGKATYSCHMKTNNEPGNSADDSPNTVEQILNNWQELMRTGLRLCSESSHDGSWAHLDEFISEIDRRGWRCDILDLHCYWAGGFDNMEYYYNKYGKRPIWISEFVWGASWNNNGIFATDRSFSVANQQKNLDAMKGIFASLNSSPYVERYAYWNSEADCSKLLRGEDELSLTGKYFQTMQSGMAYRKAYEKIPNVVYTYPTEVSGKWVSQSAGIYRVSWNDSNFDLLNEMQVQRRKEGEEYQVVGVVRPTDQNAKSATYSYNDTITESGLYEYRVVNITAENTERRSGVVQVAKSNHLSAQGVEYGELTLINGDAQSITFGEEFSSVPAVFMGVVTNNNTKLHPGTLLSDVTKKKFTYQPMLWTGSTSTNFEEQESLPFMALEQGNYTFNNLDCEVGVAKVYMSDTCEVRFAKPFPEGVTPVVLTEIRKPMTKTYALVAKVKEVTNTGFKCIVMVEEGNKVTTINYDVCYLAITPGVGTVDDEAGLMIAAGRSDEALFGSMTRSCSFAYEGETLRFVDPYIFANTQTNRYDAATMVRRNKVLDTEKVGDVTYTVGAKFKRVTDAGRKNGSDGVKLNGNSMKDDLGWVVLYHRAEGTSMPTAIKALAEERVEIRPYVVDHTICVDGYNDFDVYTLQGMKVDSHKSLDAGIYVVRVADVTTMVVVK